MTTTSLCLLLGAALPMIAPADGAARGAWYGRGADGTPATASAERHSDRSQDPPGRSDVYTCPMHPSVRAQEPGRCPICGMDLTSAGGDVEAGGGRDAATFRVSEERRRVIGVRYDTVAVRRLADDLRAFGVAAYDERRIAAVNLRASGWIDTVAADFEGMDVRRGDLLARVYSPEMVAAQREHLLASRTADDDLAWTVDAVTEGAGIAGATRDRLLHLGFDEARILELERRREPERSVRIHSPADGVVIGKSAVQGAFVEPGTTLYTIADLSTVWLLADVYQSNLPRAAVGRRAEVRFPQLPGREFSGTVVFIDPRVDPQTRAARARIEIPNPDRVLKPGMYGEVVIGGAGRNVLSVEAAAVLKTGTREIAFVAGEGDRIEARIVTTRWGDTRHLEVLAGLREGERVIGAARFLIDAESRIQGVLDRLAPGGHDHGKEQRR